MSSDPNLNMITDLIEVLRLANDQVDALERFEESALQSLARRVAKIAWVGIGQGHPEAEALDQVIGHVTAEAWAIVRQASREWPDRSTLDAKLDRVRIWAEIDLAAMRAEADAPEAAPASTDGGPIDWAKGVTR